MAAKPEKEKATPKKANASDAAAKKTSTKPAKQLDDAEDDLEETDEPKLKAGKKAGGIKSKSIDDDDIDAVDDIDDEEDTHHKLEESDDWDPDFAEFDLPKSSAKKGGIPKKSPKDDDDDFKVDDEFKDLFGGGGSRGKNYNEDDDY